jgi:hypothetical protein
MARLVAGAIFSLAVASEPQLVRTLGKSPRRTVALDGGGPRSHGAAMTMIRNHFFGICREIICA